MGADRLSDDHKRPDTHLSPSEIVPMGVVCALKDATVAVRNNGTVSYLHGDHLGSVSLTSSSSGSVSTPQEFDPWGAVRSGAITSC